MVEVLFNMIVGYILAYVVKSYLIYSLLNLFFLLPFYLYKQACYFLPFILDFCCSLKSRKYFILASQQQEDGNFQGGLVSPPGWAVVGGHDLKDPPQTFQSLDWTVLLQVHRQRLLSRAHLHDKYLILIDLNIISFSHGE